MKKYGDYYLIKDVASEIGIINASQFFKGYSKKIETGSALYAHKAYERTPNGTRYRKIIGGHSYKTSHLGVNKKDLIFLLTKSRKQEAKILLKKIMEEK